MENQDNYMHDVIKLNEIIVKNEIQRRKKFKTKVYSMFARIDMIVDSIKRNK